MREGNKLTDREAILFRALSEIVSDARYFTGTTYLDAIRALVKIEIRADEAMSAILPPMDDS